VAGEFRKRAAYICISASGPEFSPLLEEGGYFLRPRMAAALAYTTADIDYWADLWARDWTPFEQETNHWRLRNPTRQQVLAALSEAIEWLRPRPRERDWDGGAVTSVSQATGATQTARSCWTMDL